MRKYLLIILPVASFLPATLFSQACCSGGVPLLGSLEASTTRANNWQFSLTYDFNRLSRLYSGTNHIEKDPNQRRRIAQSLLLETSYGFSKHISASVILSFIQQERRISSGLIGSTDFVTARGMGDAIGLLKYSIIPINIVSQLEFVVGAGAKVPFGSTDLKSQGIRISDDLQPGTGAWDGILWGYFFRGFEPHIPMNIYLQSSYRLTGTNSFGYKFGNEFILTLGGTSGSKGFLNYSLSFRYRAVQPDKRDDVELPNSGGKWLYIGPGLNLNLSPSVGVKFSGQVPIYHNLEGTQLTTTYRLSVSLFYILF